MEQIIINDYLILAPIVDNINNKVKGVVLGEYDSPINCNARGTYPKRMIALYDKSEIDDVIDALDSFRTKYFSK